MSEVRFESEAAAPQGGLPSGTYAQALFALQYDQGVAENVFARVAKRGLRNFVERKTRMHTDDGDISPVWVDQITVVLGPGCVPEKQPGNDTVTLDSIRLEALVARLAATIQSTCLEDGLVLWLDALRVRVQDVGDGRYSFSVKQKWGVDDGS